MAMEGKGVCKSLDEPFLTKEESASSSVCPSPGISTASSKSSPPKKRNKQKAGAGGKNYARKGRRKHHHKWYAFACPQQGMSSVKENSVPASSLDRREGKSKKNHKFVILEKKNLEDSIEENLVCDICSEDINKKNIFAFADKLKKAFLAIHHDKVTDCVGWYQKKTMKQENVEMKFSPVGCASSMMVHCRNDHQYTRKANRRGKVYTKKLITYDTYVKLLLTSLMMGIGGEGVRTFLTFLDVLHAKSFGRSGMSTLKDEIGDTIQDVAVAKMDKALQEEIKLTLEREHNEWEKGGKEPHTFEQWSLLPTNCPKKHAEIVVCFDMGWQKREHNSFSGHIFMISCLSQKNLHCIVCAKQCQKCQRAKANDRSVKKHKCPKTMMTATRQWKQAHV
eukprot:15365616-Ditylum_brightwellii.AAC.1